MLRFLCLALLLGVVAGRVDVAAQGSLRATMVEGARGGSGPGGESGESGASGESGMSEEEIEAQEAKQAELLNKVKELAAIHREAQEELSQALHGNTKMTAEAKAVVMKRGATADSTDSALINSLTANENAVKALEKSKKAHMALVEAKLAAGLKVGKRKGGVEAQICRKKLKDKEKEARKLAKKAHAQASKAWASSQYTKLKMRKAAAIAKELQNVKSRDQMQTMLTRSNKASEEAKAARMEAIDEQTAAAKFQAEADDIREEASRIADECSFLLAKQTIAGLGWKGVKSEKPAASGGDDDLASAKPAAPEQTGTDKTVEQAEAKLFGLNGANQQQSGFAAGQAADAMLKDTIPVQGKPPSTKVISEARRLLADEEKDDAEKGESKPEYPQSKEQIKETRAERIEDIANRAETDTANSMHEKQ